MVGKSLVFYLALLKSHIVRDCSLKCVLANISVALTLYSRNQKRCGKLYLLLPHVNNFYAVLITCHSECKSMLENKQIFLFFAQQEQNKDRKYPEILKTTSRIDLIVVRFCCSASLPSFTLKLM